MAAYQSESTGAAIHIAAHYRERTAPTPAPAPNGHAVPTINIQDLFERSQIATDLAAVDELLLQRTNSRSALISAAGAHTVRAGGKRLRAAIALLAAHLGSYVPERVLHAAAAVELIHAASLVHDDLVDQAARRRGHVTVHARWDNDVALMVGDYFFALASVEMALSPDPRIITFYARAVQTIVEGELSPVMLVAPFEEALQQYLFKTGSKTAALFEAAARAGMASGGGSDASITALGRYGYDLGLAYQIVDDVLDFVGDERVLGKPAGNDLRQGTLTLPLLYAVRNGGSATLQEMAVRTPTDDAEVAAIIAEVVERGGVYAAMEHARCFGAQAVSYLEVFPASPAREALADLARFVIERQA